MSGERESCTFCPIANGVGSAVAFQHSLGGVFDAFVTHFTPAELDPDHQPSTQGEAGEPAAAGDKLGEHRHLAEGMT
jgi:hypothetical protein